MASNIDKRELNLQSKQGPIDNVEEDVQLIASCSRIMASNIDKRELNLQSKQGPIDNVEEDVQLIPPEETKIDSYEAFKELVSDYSHLRVVRNVCCRSYSHHFLVTNIRLNKEPVKVTIVHYTSSCDIFTERKSMAVGKFKSQTFTLGDQLAKDLLDFDTGVYLIGHPDVGEKRSWETMYFVGLCL